MTEIPVKSSDIVKLESFEQPKLSLTDIVYIPLHKLEARLPEFPFDHIVLYIADGLPPLTTALAVPSHDWHVLLFKVKSIKIGLGSFKVMVSITAHPTASITCTTCSPANKFDIMLV